MLHIYTNRKHCFFHLILTITILLTSISYATNPKTTSSTPHSTARETQTPTALDLYVYKPDPSYRYELKKTVPGDVFTIYIIKLTSQRWRSPEEVDRTLWEHWLSIVVPKKVKHETALLIVSGGKNTDEVPETVAPMVRTLANQLNCIIADIKQIPNQPLVFTDDGRKRSEDAIIAYNWDKFLRTGDPEWLTRFPMTKAVVRAMDTIQEFCTTQHVTKKPIKNFIVAGASKRGWTTWTTTIVDNRVIACIPIVIDCLNLVPSFKHHYAVYGQWAPAIDDYVEMKIMDWLVTPEFAELLKLVDPYSYRNRLTMPKFIINSAGDEFFLPDSWKFYFNDLPQPTYLRYVPNTGHSLQPDVVQSITAFCKAILSKKPIPQFQWEFPNDSTIIVRTQSKPNKVILWEAVNPTARDFRFNVLGKAYKPTELKEQNKNTYIAQVQQPESGWKAYLVEIQFPGPEDTTFTFSTPVRIVPDTEPFQYNPPQELPKGFLSK